jgi:FAD/FMN-containing dehydrogenase
LRTGSNGSTPRQHEDAAKVAPAGLHKGSIPTWTRETYGSLSPHLAGRRYVNYLDDDRDDAVRAAYGPNHARLAEIKRTYDPDNVFRLNHNIAPAT